MKGKRYAIAAEVKGWYWFSEAINHLEPHVFKVLAVDEHSEASQQRLCLRRHLETCHAFVQLLCVKTEMGEMPGKIQVVPKAPEQVMNLASTPCSCLSVYIA